MLLHNHIGPTTKTRGPHLPNRLSTETSPYLIQHSDDPVDWYPWGEEALRKSRELDKPILLSIGYSACHWCHVMQHESFQNPEIAEQMNKQFINIKVDREERPDLDSIYMRAIQLLTGHGGWPMTVFLTPERKPFYGGTYFPPRDAHGIPGFKTVLDGLFSAYYNQRDEIENATHNIIKLIHKNADHANFRGKPSQEVFDRAFSILSNEFDPIYGGFGGAPKFPQPMILSFLLRYHYSTNNVDALRMVEFTLKRMAYGGIYDQLGGGFHRYSTDAKWLVPHFEKMLYDNALLSRVYLETYKITGNHFYKKILKDTLDYVLREMTGTYGGFFSSQDADSENVEGKFFLWSQEEILKELGEDDFLLFNRLFDVSPEGNFENENILSIKGDLQAIAESAEISVKRLESIIQANKQRLLDVRNKRIAPSVDEKQLTSWNGLMLAVLADAAGTLQEKKYELAAIRNASFLKDNLFKGTRLLRTHNKGLSQLNGYLEDYSFLALGMLSVYKLTLDPAWLKTARGLIDDMLDLFWEETELTFYDTGADHETLMIRPRESFDNAIPSGASVACAVLLQMSVLTGEKHYHEVASKALESITNLATQHPYGMGEWLGVLDFYVNKSNEVAIIGNREDPDGKALLQVIYDKFLPHTVFAASTVEDPKGLNPSPILKFRTKINGKPSAYVCTNYSCQSPVTDPEVLAKQLEIRG